MINKQINKNTTTKQKESRFPVRTSMYKAVSRDNMLSSQPSDSLPRPTAIQQGFFISDEVVMLNKPGLTNRTGGLLRSLMLVFLIGTAFSQSFAQYEMKKHTINSGGSILTGGDYEMQSSTGQTDASNTLSGGSFSLNGGFWQENNDLIFKNDFE